MTCRCGLGLNSLQPTDVPLVEHARFSPRCAFLLRITGGRTFARGIVAGQLERRAQRSAHDMEELCTALREFSDAIGILLLLAYLFHYLSHFVYYCTYCLLVQFSRCIPTIASNPRCFIPTMSLSLSLTHSLSLFYRYSQSNYSTLCGPDGTALSMRHGSVQSD